MPPHKPHASSYSLNDLVLVTAFVEFILSMTAAGLMRYHNGMVTILYVLGIALDARGSIIEWIDNRKQKKKLHEMLRKRDARRATNSTRNTNSAQRCVTGPIDGVAARNGRNGQANVDQGMVVANPLTTTNTNTPSSICIHSTPSSASGESEVPSQTEEWRAKSQNQESVLVTKGDGVELELQQLAPALSQEKSKTNSVPLATYIRNSKVPTPSNASFPAEAKGMSEEPVAIHPTIEVEMNTQGDRFSSTLLMPPQTRETIAIGNDTHNKQTEIRTITAENLSTTGAISLVFPATSKLSGAPDRSLSSQADDSEANPKLCPTTTEGDEVGIQEFIAVGNDCYEEATHLLTKKNTEETGDSLSPIASDNTLATNFSVLVGRYAEHGTITQNDLWTGATSSIRVASSTVLGALDSLVPSHVENLKANQWMHTTTKGDEAGVQEHREATPDGDYIAVGQCKEQIVVIHDSPLKMRNMDDTPSTTSRRVPSTPDEASEGEKKVESVEAVPDIGALVVP